MAFKNINIPSLVLSYKKKTEAWRKKHLDWADSKSFLNYSPTRQSYYHKKINYDLTNGILDMKDLMAVLNPTGIEMPWVPKSIQHYPIINAALEMLRGEESARVFDVRISVTNPTAISQMEQEKLQKINQQLEQIVMNQSASEEEVLNQLREIDLFYRLNYQDVRERMANQLLNHYNKELNFDLIFHKGMWDVYNVGEEVYQCDIENGEPVLRRLNPKKISAFRNGYSSDFEKADIIIYEDYWAPGKIIDVYHESLKEKDIKWISDFDSEDVGDNDYNYNQVDEDGKYGRSPVKNFIRAENIIASPEDDIVSYVDGIPGYDITKACDQYGNIRVLKMFWKSKRKIKKVKSYNEMTGEEEYHYYNEDYICDEAKGETEEVFWINQAWEGIKIGKDIYINMQPRKLQYNKMSNPSLCHFGIVGSIYNENESKAYSLVDMMKPYNYFYDVIQDRLNRMIERDMGSLIRYDIAKMPSNKYTLTEIISIMKSTGLMIENSFNECQEGAGRGKIAGAFNNNSTGIVNGNNSQIVQSYIQLLEAVKQEMNSIIGITPQRLGQIQNRETVGGVERSTLQSSYVTEWLFVRHNDVKKRVIECFIETAKIAVRQNKEKFKYILSDKSKLVADEDESLFCECDFGLVVDCSNLSQRLNQKLEQLAEVGLQSQLLKISDVFTMFKSCSLAEKEAMIKQKEEQQEQQMQEEQKRQQQMQQQQLQSAENQIYMQQEFEREKQDKELNAKDVINQRDNQTRLNIASMQANSNTENNLYAQIQAQMQQNYEQVNKNDQKELQEKKREFDIEIDLKKQLMEQDERHHKEDNKLKEEIERRKAAIARRKPKTT